MESIDPTTFDAIVVGTGLPESILAAAAASSGRKVLHLDHEDFYGSEWASSTLDQLALCDGHLAPLPNELEQTNLLEVPVGRRFRSREVHSYDADELGSSRGYSLDFAGPKLAFAAGPLINLLLSSGASNYLEFKSIDATYIWNGDSLTSAPASRRELYQCQSLSLTDKRLLWRFMVSVQAYLSGEAEPDSSFSDEELNLSFMELLRRQQLSAFVQSMVLYAVAFLDEDQENTNSPLSAKEGMQLLALHQASIGRFANSTGAFLYPLYGQGELPQAFCRTAAVNGALYVLRRPVTSVLFSKDTGEYKGVRTGNGQLLYSEKLVLGSSLKLDLEHTSPSQEPSKIARCICVTESSLDPAKMNVLLVFPPGTISSKLPNPVRVLQLGSGTAVCPSGKFVLQMSTVITGCCSGKEALQPVLDFLVSPPESNSVAGSILHQGVPKPKILWTAFYIEKAHKSQVTGNAVGICPAPGPSLDYSSVISSTEKMFHELFGEDQWFTGTTDQTPPVDES